MLARAQGFTSTVANSFYTLIGSVCDQVLVNAPPGPYAVGSQVALSANATCTGGTPAYRFSYSVNDPNAADVLIEFRAWDTSPSATWNTTGLSSGSYNLSAWARNAANTSTYEATGHAIVNLDDANPGTPVVDFVATRTVALPWSLSFAPDGSAVVIGLATSNATRLDAAGAWLGEWNLPAGSIPRG